MAEAMMREGPAVSAASQCYRTAGSTDLLVRIRLDSMVPVQGPALAIGVGLDKDLLEVAARRLLPSGGAGPTASCRVAPAARWQVRRVSSGDMRKKLAHRRQLIFEVDAGVDDIEDRRDILRIRRGIIHQQRRDHQMPFVGPADPKQRRAQRAPAAPAAMT